MSDIYERKEQVMHRVWLLMVRIAFIFGIPAGIAFFAGRYFDNFYNSYPKFTLLTLFPSFILSWAITIREYKKISAQFRKLREEEDIVIAQKQKKLHDEIDKEIKKEI